MNNQIAENHSDYIELVKWFKLRHIFKTNMCPVDKDCIGKIPELNDLKGRKYKLTISQLDEFIISMEKLRRIKKYNE